MFTVWRTATGGLATAVAVLPSEEEEEEPSEETSERETPNRGLSSMLSMATERQRNSSGEEKAKRSRRW